VLREPVRHRTADPQWQQLLRCATEPDDIIPALSKRESGLVFTTAPIEPRNVNRTFDVLCAKAQVRRMRVHDSRRSCATLLFTVGVEPPSG
jgi:hypothetical protein